MKPRLAYIVSLVLLALLFPVFAAQKNTRKVTIPEAVWAGTTLLPPGDYEVNWDGSYSAVQVNFQQGNKSIAKVRTMASADLCGPHGRAIVKIRAISESSKALDMIVWKDVSLTFEMVQPF